MTEPEWSYRRCPVCDEKSYSPPFGDRLAANIAAVAGAKLDEPLGPGQVLALGATPRAIAAAAIRPHLDFCGGGEFCSLDDCLCDCHGAPA